MELVTLSESSLSFAIRLSGFMISQDQVINNSFDSRYSNIDSMGVEKIVC